jgi:hypothetical protein
MKAQSKTIYGIYSGPDEAQRMVDALVAAGSELHIRRGQVVVFSSEPFDGYDFADQHARTHLFQLAALGGLVGGACGYGLTALTQRAYPLATGGMPIVSLWTNGIIVYEMGMLGAIIFTIVALLGSARLPHFRAPLTDPAMWEGKILVGVADPPEESLIEIVARLRQAGAQAVRGVQNGGSTDAKGASGDAHSPNES